MTKENSRSIEKSIKDIKRETGRLTKELERINARIDALLERLSDNSLKKPVKSSILAEIEHTQEHRNRVTEQLLRAGDMHAEALKALHSLSTIPLTPTDNPSETLPIEDQDQLETNEVPIEILPEPEPEPEPEPIESPTVGQEERKTLELDSEIYKIAIQVDILLERAETKYLVSSLESKNLDPSLEKNKSYASYFSKEFKKIEGDYEKNKEQIDKLPDELKNQIIYRIEYLRYIELYGQYISKNKSDMNQLAQIITKYREFSRKKDSLSKLSDIEPIGTLAPDYDTERVDSGEREGESLEDSPKKGVSISEGFKRFARFSISTAFSVSKGIREVLNESRLIFLQNELNSLKDKKVPYIKLKDILERIHSTLRKEYRPQVLYKYSARLIDGIERVFLYNKDSYTKQELEFFYKGLLNKILFPTNPTILTESLGELVIKNHDEFKPMVDLYDYKNILDSYLNIGAQELVTQRGRVKGKEGVKREILSFFQKVNSLLKQDYDNSQFGKDYFDSLIDYVSKNERRLPREEVDFRIEILREIKNSLS